MRLQTPVGLLLGVAMWSLTVAAQAAPPGVARSVHPRHRAGQPRTRVFSPGLVAGGAVLTLASLFFTAGLARYWFSDTSCRRRSTCDDDPIAAQLGTAIILGGLVGGSAMMVIGARSVPVSSSAVLVPWATTRAGGLSLQLRL